MRSIKIIQVRLFVISCLLVIFLIPTLSLAQSIEENKQLVRSYVEALNQKNWPELIGVAFTSEQVEKFKKIHTPFRAAFPDYHFTIDELIAEGDKVVVRGTVSATHKGEFPFGELKGVAPAGKLAKWKEVWVIRIAYGKFADGWFLVDVINRMQQLGLKCLPEQEKK